MLALISFVTLLGAATVAPAPALPAAATLQVLATTPDLADLARRVGGDRVTVKCLLKGPEDPHFVDARPSFISAANRCDVFVLNGLDLEIAWAPLLVTESRNPRIQPGSDGYVDASRGVTVLEVPTGTVDRSMGDVHTRGNPHYLLDPCNARIVARTLRDAFKRGDAAGAAGYDARCTALEKAVDAALFGDKLLATFDAGELAGLLAQGKLVAFLQGKGRAADLGGWAARLAPLAGAPLVSYHGGALWYFAHRFDLQIVGALEPKPGIAPSTAHLARIIDTMKQRSVKAVFHAVYNARSAVEAVCSRSGARAALFAHQSGAVPPAADWFAMMDFNVGLAADVLGGR